jgi:hypothetical protein
MAAAITHGPIHRSGRLLATSLPRWRPWPPFRVSSAPKDVTIYGYSGKHLEMIVPELPVGGEGEHGHFTRCADGDLKSWVAPIDTAEPGDAFYGYTGPGYRKEFGSSTSTGPGQ